MRIGRLGVLVFAVLGVLSGSIASAGTEIVYWGTKKPGDGTPIGNALARNLERFHAKYPDIRVNAEVVPFALLDSQLIQGTAAGSTPDVARIYNYFLPMHVSARSIQPLDGFAERTDKADWLLPWKSTLIEGKKYGLPYEHRFFAMLYRKDILDRAGVQVPTTWDEMCTAAGKINSPQVMGYGFGLSQGESAAALLEWAENMVLAAGGRLLDEKGRAAPNNPAVLRFLQTIADLAGRCKASGRAVAGFTYESLHRGLASGTVAMAGLGTHRYVGIRAAGAKDNLEWAPLPSFEIGKRAQVRTLGFYLAMGRHAKHPEAAWKFIEFMTSREAQVTIAQSGEMPTRKSTYDDPWFKEPAAKVMSQWSDYIVRNGSADTYPKGWLTFGQTLAEQTQSIVLTGLPPQKAWANVVEKWNKFAERD